MATQNPSLVFLIEPNIARLLRSCAVHAGVPMAALVRGACQRALERPMRPIGLGATPRIERVRVHVSPALKAALQLRADGDGMKLGSWVAAAVGDAMLEAFGRYEAEQSAA